MFARCVRYSLRMGAQSTFETMAAELASYYREREGFQSLTCLIEGALSEYVILSTWDSREQAEAAAYVIPDAQQWLERMLLGPPVVRTYEVFVPL
jgi:heme-degrading monooxygenase HmoA